MRDLLRPSHAHAIAERDGQPSALEVPMTTPCPFCDPAEPLLGNALAVALFDLNPVTPGHLLVLTRRHVASYFEATAEEKSALLELIDAARPLLDQRFQPAGYNIGINVGATAGQTVMHLHVHLIPRYRDDVANPRGGVRGVIPARQNY